MKLNTIKIAIVFGLLVLSGCKNYDELVVNPNLPTSVPASLLFTGVLNQMGDDLAWTDAPRYNQFWLSTYTYYGTNNYDQAPFITSNFGGRNPDGVGGGSYYLTIENVERMEIEATKAGAGVVNPYAALGKFFRAYYFNLMSQKFGDLPVSQAEQGSLDPTPKYDTQKEIYIQILEWLDDSNSMLSQLIIGNDATLAGDIYFNNNLRAWQKVVNSYTLRVLVSLSKKASDPDLNIKQKFAAIVGNASNYPILTGTSDNLQYVYNSSFTPYPKNPGNYLQQNTRENISATILNLTTSFSDPRAFIVATPAPKQVANNIMKIISGGTTAATVTTKPAHPYVGGETVVITGASVAGYNVTGVIQSVPNDTTLTYTVAVGLADIPRQPKLKGADVAVGSVGKKISDYTAYVGASLGTDIGTLGINSQAGLYSFENALRYASTYDGSNAEPAMIVGYPEMCFNIAEGLNMGWATGTTSTWYVNGITASMNFFGIKDNASLTIADNAQNVLGTVTVSLTNYLSQASVQYQGDNAAGLNQILTQKYIAFWQNSNWEAFFNQRRTGVPVFLVGPGTGNNTKLPLRWQYPLSEASANAANYQEAIQRQFGGTDNLDGKMWILQ